MRRWSPALNVNTATTPPMPATAPTSAGLTGTAVRPRPRSKAIRTPMTVAGPAPPRLRRWASERRCQESLPSPPAPSSGRSPATPPPPRPRGSSRPPPRIPRAGRACRRRAQDRARLDARDPRQKRRSGERRRDPQAGADERRGEHRREPRREPFPPAHPDRRKRRVIVCREERLAAENDTQGDEPREPADRGEDPETAGEDTDRLVERRAQSGHRLHPDGESGPTTSPTRLRNSGTATSPARPHHRDGLERQDLIAISAVERRREQRGARVLGPLREVVPRSGDADNGERHRRATGVQREPLLLEPRPGQGSTRRAAGGYRVRRGAGRRSPRSPRPRPPLRDRRAGRRRSELG